MHSKQKQMYIYSLVMLAIVVNSNNTDIQSTISRKGKGCCLPHNNEEDDDLSALTEEEITILFARHNF